MYDPQCEVLAKYFLVDQDPPSIVKSTTANVEALANVIQNAIEDWFTEKEQDYERERDQ